MSSPGPGAVLAVVVDVLFATRITEAARLAGRTCRIVSDAPGAEAAHRELSPSLILVDLSLPPAVHACVLHAASARRAPGARIVAFGSHVDRETLEAARAAGADEAWPRSLFVRRLDELMRG
jgi:DNA-binding NarL/FixJ family response regulator